MTPFTGQIMQILSLQFPDPFPIKGPKNRLSLRIKKVCKIRAGMFLTLESRNRKNEISVQTTIIFLKRDKPVAPDIDTAYIFSVIRKLNGMIYRALRYLGQLSSS